jgi:hypothetical protein
MKGYVSVLSIAAGLAFTAGCAGGAASLDNNRHDQAGARRTSFRLALEGCVQQSSHGNEFTLNNVYVRPPAEQPMGAETMDKGPIVARGSWVRLNDQSEDLKQFLGKRIEVIGVVADTGENTIGTSGQAEDSHAKYVRSAGSVYTNPDRNGPPSNVAPASADANGNAPLIAVEHVTQIADSCGNESGKQ